jgi:transcriptional regulator of acetoin/glycerol metabolism
VLKSAEGHVERAAARLGVPRSSLYAKLKRFGISASEL